MANLFFFESFEDQIALVNSMVRRRAFSLFLVYISGIEELYLLAGCVVVRRISVSVLLEFIEINSEIIPLLMVLEQVKMTPTTPITH